MHAGDARSALAGEPYADLRWVAVTGSTNADLAEAARRGEGRCALVADAQSQGRGRLDRRWESPPGAAVMMSVIAPGPFPPAGPQLVTIAMAIAATDAVRAVCGQDVGLKWPNDLVVGVDGGARKLGGLLAERVGDDRVVVGIGLNVAWAGRFPPELADIATSLDHLGHDVSRWDLVVEILRRFGALEPTLDRPGAGEALMDRYRSACVTVGQHVRVELPRAVLVGTAVGVADDGALIVRDDQGVRREVTVGDVVHLRPADGEVGGQGSIAPPAPSP